MIPYIKKNFTAEDRWHVHFNVFRMIRLEIIARFCWHLLEVSSSSNRNTSFKIFCVLLCMIISQSSAYLTDCDACTPVCVYIQIFIWLKIGPLTETCSDVPLAQGSRRCLRRSSLFVYISIKKLEIISTLLRQIGIPPPTVAPWREALYKDRQSNWRVGVF